MIADEYSSMWNWIVTPEEWVAGYSALLIISSLSWRRRFWGSDQRHKKIGTLFLLKVLGVGSQPVLHVFVCLNTGLWIWEFNFRCAFLNILAHITYKNEIKRHTVLKPAHIVGPVHLKTSQQIHYIIFHYIHIRVPFAETLLKFQCKTTLLPMCGSVNYWHWKFKARQHLL